MDFDDELRKFARSGMPLRQMRESASWQIEIWVGNDCLQGDARDLSRGGLGALVKLDAKWQDNLTMGKNVLLSLLWQGKDIEPLQRIPAHVIWVKKNDEDWQIGFRFDALDEVADLHIERYLLASVVTRHLTDDETHF